VEDCGLVIGQALEQARIESDDRYGQAVIPMDDALSECIVDACGRPYLSWNVVWPQQKAGDFDLFLLREFFWGLAVAGKLNLPPERPVRRKRSSRRRSSL
jgi:imidazoleglycerol-phosphate dehydratase